jgi:hypothetical protein
MDSPIAVSRPEQESSGRGESVVTTTATVSASAPVNGNGNGAAPAPAPVPEATQAAVPAVTVTTSGWRARLASHLRRQPEAAAPAPARTTPGDGVRLRPSRKKAKTLHLTLPAWAVSVVVHVGVLTALGLASLSSEVRQAVANINAAMVDTSLTAKQAEEQMPILADPSSLPRELASGAMEMATPGLGSGSLTGAGAPSATPRVTDRPVSERAAMAAVTGLGSRGMASLSPIAVKPPAVDMNRELGDRSGGGGGMPVGDAARPTVGIGEALDQIAREILLLLERGPVTVVWLFDESISMKDDQQAIKDKFARVGSELRKNLGNEKLASTALLHAVVGFGEKVHFNLGKPTADIDEVATAINRLSTDTSGIENTCQAILAVVNRYGGQGGGDKDRDRRVMVILATDESGDDGVEYLEAARAAAVRARVPIYVIGRQSMFGKSSVVLPFKDQLTGDTYWPTIRRGPESAEYECLQYDGLHGRWDEQPAGFAPYELGRLTRDTGGIYFLLPNEEGLRATRREKAYSSEMLKEYRPGTDGRAEYRQIILRSPLRRGLMDVIDKTRAFGFRHRYPVEPGALARAIDEEFPKVTLQLNILIALEKGLRSLAEAREHEADRRWQAHYDLMLAQVVAYQIQAYEYRACLKEMAQKLQAGQLRPSKQPIPDQLVVEWEINHAPDYRAPKMETEKVRVEATRLLKQVIERHAGTPWADLAQDEINRGFGCRLGEWRHNPQYDRRAALVPKF